MKCDECGMYSESLPCSYCEALKKPQGEGLKACPFANCPLLNTRADSGAALDRVLHEFELTTDPINGYASAHIRLREIITRLKEQRKQNDTY